MNLIIGAAGNVILSDNNLVICSWFPVFFGVVLRILSLNDLTS